jgi:hypothetical protein
MPIKVIFGDGDGDLQQTLTVQALQVRILGSVNSDDGYELHHTNSLKGAPRVEVIKELNGHKIDKIDGNLTNFASYYMSMGRRR